LAKKIRLGVGRHDCPVSKIFPVIGSLLPIRPSSSRFKLHEAEKTTQRRKADELRFSTHPQHPEKYHVVVTPETTRPQITVLIDSYFEDKKVSTDKGFSVFH